MHPSASHPPKRVCTHLDGGQELREEEEVQLRERALLRAQVGVQPIQDTHLPHRWLTSRTYLRIALRLISRLVEPSGTAKALTIMLNYIRTTRRT